MRTRPIVAIDLDDVCADRLEAISSLLAYEGVTTPSRQPRNWDLSDWGVTTKQYYDRLHYGAFVERAGYVDLNPIEGALEGIRRIHEMGGLVRILTGRLWTSQVAGPALSGTGNWLEKHSVPVDDVAFVSDKTAVDADIYIEDAPHFIDDLTKAGRNVLIMSTPYNMRTPGRRVLDWPDIVKAVTQLF